MMPTECEALFPAKRPRFWPFNRGFPRKRRAPTHRVNRLLSDLWTLPAASEEGTEKTKKHLTGRPFRGMNAGVMIELNLRLLLGALLSGRAAVGV
jgi:hypothetical protein